MPEWLRGKKLLPNVMKPLARVAAAADKQWFSDAYRSLVLYLRHHDEVFVDDFWEEVGLPEPRESRALGPVFLKAARAGLMEKTGVFRKSIRSHLTEKPVWRSRIRV